jgi:hypothetical protein
MCEVSDEPLCETVGQETGRVRWEASLHFVLQHNMPPQALVIMLGCKEGWAVYLCTSCMTWHCQ